MIQLNLLPDVKMQFIKAQRTKHVVLMTALIISGTAIGIVMFLATIVYGAQVLQLNSLNDAIKSKTTDIKKIDDLNKILTIQNQLNALPGLFEQKPVISRVFVFLPQITPTDVNIADYKLKLEDNTMSFTGTAKDILTVNKFVDTLKFTKYTTDTNQELKPAFNTVVLTAFARTDKEATYTIDLKFDPALFSAENKVVTLAVPKITSTRSETERPTSLFQEQPAPTTGGTR